MRHANDNGAPAPPPDFALRLDGGSAILTPLNEAAETWVEECVSAEAMHLTGGVIIEHRYISNIICGLRDDGLIVEAA